MIWALVGLLVLGAVAGLLAGAWALRLGPAIAGVVCGLAAVAIALVHVTRAPEKLPLDPNPGAAFRIAALGDSYISGEGAGTFFPATDDSRGNQCHRAASAHPYLAAEDLGASLTFIACSAARTWHVTGRDAAGKRVRGQYPQNRDVFGWRAQITELRALPRFDAVLLSIGGNDAGFSEIGRGCATPGAADCRRSASYWIDRLDKDVYPALVRTYTAVREAAKGAPVFALTYPNPIGPRDCPDIGLTRGEMGFVRDVFIGRLNELIRFAAVVARVRFIELKDALAGRRFCERPLAQTAVNFIGIGRTAGSRIDLKRLGSLGHNTFHPNAIGHALMEKPVLERLRAVEARTLEPLAEPPPPGIPPPPFVPDEIGPPVGPHPFPSGTRCTGASIAFVTPLAAEPDVRRVLLSGLRRRSTVCYRSYHAAWHAVRADGEGTARVPVDVRRAGVGSINEVLVEQPGGVWKRVLVSRLGEQGEHDPPKEPSNAGLYIVIASLALALGAALVLRWVSLRRRRNRVGLA